MEKWVICGVCDEKGEGVYYGTHIVIFSSYVVNSVLCVTLSRGDGFFVVLTKSYAKDWGCGMANIGMRFTQCFAS